MKVLNWGFSFVAALLVLSGANLAHARGGGNGVPSPFKCVSPNQELVSGKAYTIEGEVEINGQGEVFFHASVKRYPCLEGENVFLLSGSMEDWQQYDRESIVLGCIPTAATLGSESVIELSPVSNDKPIILRDNHEDR
jgi:hypothetical protein